MKIIDGLKLGGATVEIPGCGRNDLPRFFKEMGFGVGVEIGVYKGDYSEILCEAGLKIYSIDPWMAYPEYHGLRSDQARFERNFERAKRRLRKYDCTIIRKTSMEAVKDFKDKSMDFVYIDGNHDFMHVTEDIWEWSKKVKPGGIIAGHDYRNDDDNAFYTDVKHVVDAYTKAGKITKLYILGKEGELDKDRSWFWFNT